MRQQFRRVLAVAMQQNHNVEALLDEVFVPRFLIPAVAEVFRMLQYPQFRQTRAADVIVVAGGVSVGEKDLVKPTLLKLGAKLDLWRVAVKPGKPFMFGRLGRTLVFGLPGNPVSAFVTFLLFARPGLWKLGGRSSLDLPRARARLAETLANRGERPHYLRGVYAHGFFKAVGRQESHALFALSQANALCRLEPNQVIAADSLVDVIPFFDVAC
jgi:molybdopterin molybdotransferase